MKSLPSSSKTCAPLPRTMCGGTPGTARYARTGLSTPPGSTRSARSRSARALLSFMALGLLSHGDGLHQISLRDRKRDGHPRFDLAEQVVAGRQLRRIVGDADEELRPVGVRSAVRHRHRTVNVLLVYRLIGELEPWAAVAAGS